MSFKRYMKSWAKPVLGLLIFILAIYSIGIVFGLSAFVVSSDSMEPTLYVGDIIISQRVNASAIRVGDIVVYNAYSGGVRIVHRVIDIRQINSKLSFITKGDKYPSPDYPSISPDRILGKLILFPIPRVGVVRLMFENVDVLPLLGGILALVFVLDYIMWRRSIKKRQRLVKEEEAVGETVAESGIIDL